MSISSASSVSSQQQLYQLELAAGLISSPSSSTTQTAQSTVAPQAAGTPAVGGLAQTILQALAQSGVTTSTAATSAGSATSAGGTATASATDPAQALQSFIQALAAALQSQTNGSTSATTAATAASTPITGSDPASNTQGASGVHGHHGHGHGGGSTDAALQNLIADMDGSTASATGTDSATTPANAAVTSLQQSYQNLVTAMGGNASTASLSTFLTNFASDLSASGNLVSTQA